MVELRRLAGPLIGIVGILLILLYTNPVVVLSKIKHVNPFFILLAAATEVLGGVLYTLAWYLILKPSGISVSFKRAYLITMGSLFLIYTTPSGVTAEAVRISMTRKHAADYGGPTASVIIHRVLYALGFVSVASLATFIVYSAFSTSPFIKTAFYAILSTLALVSVALGLSVYAKFLKGFVKQVLTRLSPLIKKISKREVDLSEVDRAFDSFAFAISKIKHSPIRLLTSYVVIALRWVLVSVVALLVMYSLNYQGLSIWAIMIVMMIAELVSTTPIGIPGMLGVLDAVIIASYVALGVPLDIATAADILTRLVLYSVNIPLTGSLFYAYISRTVSRNIENPAE
ncbi:MAG: flippase-like domain-containing protein [Thermoprotei archaeon]